MRSPALLLLAACGSYTPERVPPVVESQAPVPVPPAPDAGTARPMPAETPKLRLFSGGGRVVAQWEHPHTTDCTVAVLHPPEAPTIELTYTMDTRIGECGSVAVTTDAIYAAAKQEIVRWKAGVMTPLIKLPDTPWETALGSVGETVYVLRWKLGTYVTRIDATGMTEILRTPEPLIGDIVIVGDSMMLSSGLALTRIRGSEVTTLREFPIDDKMAPRPLGGTETEVALCEHGMIQLVSVASGKTASTKRACKREQIFGRFVYVATPAPSKLTRSVFADDGKAQDIVTSAGEIGQVLPANGWVFYVTYQKPGDPSTSKLAWVQR